MATLNVNSDEFTIFNLSDVLNDNEALPPIGAVYLFTKERQNSLHEILYVGRTKNLDARDIKNHHKLWCVYLNEGTFFSVHIDLDEDSRKSKEQNIIDSYNPRCNDTPVKTNN